MAEIERVTKLEGARRQLAAAIDLFFSHGDIVAVHTLAGAAQELLRGLGKAKGVRSFMKDNSEIRPEKLKEVAAIRRKINEAENFFKHADRDPDAVLGFRPAATPFYILDGVELYGQLAGSLFPEAEVFRMWFIVKYPNVLLGDLKTLVLEAKAQGIDPDDFALIRMLLNARRSS